MRPSPELRVFFNLIKKCFFFRSGYPGPGLNLSKDVILTDNISVVDLDFGLFIV